jgi:glycosyltransferase involved in cell wall biosynthesis
VHAVALVRVIVTKRIRTLALLPAGDRFEDFHDKIGVSLEDFRTTLTGGWLFNYIEALQIAGIQTVLIFFSARVAEPLRFTHVPTGCRVSILPVPRLHQRLRALRWKLAPHSRVLRSLESYAATSPHKLAREVRLRCCDAILCQEYESARFDISSCLGWCLRLPVFASYQGADRGYSLVEVPLRRLVLPRCAGVIVGAARERDRVRFRYGVPESKIAAVPNPVDVNLRGSVSKRDARHRLGIAPNTRVVIWHGRVQMQRKGLDVLVEAWCRVCAQRPDMSLRLILVGTGPDADRLRQDLARLPTGTYLWIDEYVVDRQRMQELLSAADISVLPSRHEGFPVAVIEAMATGLAIVATDVGGVREAVGTSGVTGYVVPPADIENLVTSLVSALDDTAGTAAMGRAARRRAEEYFGLNSVGQQLLLALSK